MNEKALQQQQCPLCSGEGAAWTRRDVRGQSRELRRCGRCGFAWVAQGLMRDQTGASIYEEEMPRFMTEYPDYYQDPGAADAAAEKLQWILSHARANGRLLDVGANLGYFAKSASAKFDVLGLEPGPGIVAWGRANLQAPIEVGSIYDSREDLRGRFDVITMFDVIEHVPDPRGALDRAREYLAPGGRLFLTTPDAGSLMARLLGSQWYYVDLEQHIALFNERNLRALLEEMGFRTVSKRTFGRKYRLSYIDRRLGDLGADNVALRIAHAALLPFRLVPNGQVAINLGDVMGLVAEPMR